MSTVSRSSKRKATNAYELLGQVCEAIKAHPLNYWQAYWKATRGCDHETEDVTPLPAALDVPENTCGTAFCRAGWIVALHDGLDVIPREGFEDRAREILAMENGDGWDEVDSLFDACAVDGTPGSPEYVRRGVEGLRRFMDSNAKHLKATPVHPKG